MGTNGLGTINETVVTNLGSTSRVSPQFPSNSSPRSSVTLGTIRFTLGSFPRTPLRETIP